MPINPNSRKYFIKYVAVHNVFGHTDFCLLHLLQDMDLARLERAFFLTAVMLKMDVSVMAVQMG